MEKKLVKDTTKEDHYIEIAVGFKIIYNQNQYLAYTEVAKKKKDIHLEIYIGRLSILKDQYLLFKCETESERHQVFSYFKQVFGGEITNEIELVDFSNIERISVVSSDLFEDKMDQYPNFFTLPKKEEEISATITLPSFLLKKSPKIKEEPAEIQFVEDKDEILKPNVTSKEEILVQNPQNEVQTNMNETISNEPVMTEMNPEKPIDMSSAEVNLETPEILPISQPQIEISNLEDTPKQPIIEETRPDSASFIVPSIEIPPVNPSTIQPQTLEEPKIQKPISNSNLENDSVQFTQIEPKKQHSEKKKKKSLILLMCLVLILIITTMIVYLFVLKPRQKEPVKPNIPAEPTTAELVCTIQKEDLENNALEENSITMVYHKGNKNLLTSKEYIKVTMKDAQQFAQRKSMIVVFSKELNNTEGQKYTFEYDDKNLIYQVFIERNYEKATAEEKDETWKSTYDEANEYYLEQGYTCNGITRNKTKELNLKSKTENDTIDYNNWIITYKKATVLEDKKTLKVELEVKNNASEERTLNGLFKLFDQTKPVRISVLNQKIGAQKTETITLTISSQAGDSTPDSTVKNEAIEFDTLTSYLIELYR